VAAVQNLSAVGLELGLTPGTISKRLQALEGDLSARLFDRTTRSIRITEEGEILLGHVRRILDELDQARAAVSGNVSRPQGRIKIAASATIGRQLIAPAIVAFLECFPEIDVHIVLTDRIVGLQDDGFDIAIRTGELDDSSLIAKRLASDRQLVVAAPCYLAARGTPLTPSDLGGHDCLLLEDHSQWTLRRGGLDESVRLNGRLRSNDGEMLRQAAIAGHGLLRISQHAVADDMRQGRLVPVLAEYEVATGSAVWAIYPSAKFILPKLRVLLDFLAERFRDLDHDQQSRSVSSGGAPIIGASVSAGGRTADITALMDRPATR
jgi:DNA-binding transcriptional LysR family regulator